MYVHFVLANHSVLILSYSLYFVFSFSVICVILLLQHAYRHCVSIFI
jgi:hypothetical protein